MKANGTALITGASSGIGRELARVFAAKGHGLILVARREAAMRVLADELRTAHKVDVQVVTKDLAAPGAATALAAEVAARDLVVDILVNNAGIGTYGDFVTTDAAELHAMVQLNIVALTDLTRLLIEGMVRRGEGAVLNVASTAAFQPGPYMAGYYATKAFVLSLSEALAFELRPHGVTVTALCPGPTASEFQKRARMSASRMVRQEKMMMTSAEVARIGYDGLAAGRTIVIPGIANRIAAAIVGFMPRSLVTRAAAYITASGA